MLYNTLLNHKKMGVIKMALIPVVEFFKNLPPKQCENCGQEIEEMHECYTNHCEKCETEEIK